jgi:hypothetical protein
MRHGSETRSMGSTLSLSNGLTTAANERRFNPFLS